MGRPDALKVVDRCLEEQHSSVQTLNVAGPVPRPRVRTAPGKDSVQWSCVPHTSCVSPSLSVWRYCSASWPAGLWSGIRTVWAPGYWYVGMAACLRRNVHVHVGIDMLMYIGIAVVMCVGLFGP